MTRRQTLAVPDGESRVSPLPAALVSLALFVLYAATTCRTVGPGDSGELAVALSTWGVPHAPSFPLLALLGNLVTHAPHPGEPAFVLNLLSAAFAALACGALAHAIALLTDRSWVGAAIGLALGTSSVFWEYALVIEVFSLNALLAALLILLLAHVLRGLRDRRPVLWPLPWAALVMSGCVTHHLTLALLALPVLVVLIGQARPLRAAGVEKRAIPSAAWRSVATGVAGLLALLYIPFAARRDPPLNWGDAVDLPGLLHLLLRRDFGSGVLTTPDVVVAQVLTVGESASPLGMRHYVQFWEGVPQGMGWLMAALALIGLVRVLRREPALAWLSVLFLAALTLFFARVNAPVVPLFVGIVRPFHILPHVFLAFLAGLGAGWLMERATRVHRFAPAALCVVLFGSGALAAVRHWPFVNMRRNTFTRDLGANLMAGLPPNAVLYSSGDLFRNAFHYQRFCMGQRPDVALVEQPMLSAPWYVRQLRRRRTLELPDTMTVYSGAPATQSRAWLDLNRARPQAAIRFVDDTWMASWRMRTMGIWSAVEPRDSDEGTDSWCASFAAAVGPWRISSLETEYAETRWETTEGVFYTYALARLAALREFHEMREPGAPSCAFPPALGVPARWRGARRADYLAYQADFWQSCVAESLATPGGPLAEFCEDRALALAESSLAVASDNLQALQTLSALRHSGRHRDPREEAAMRSRIVDLRPGDLAELQPYFALVVEMMRDPALRDPALLERAENVRRRYVALLDLCVRLWPNPQLERLRAHWSAPLAGAIAPRSGTELSP